MGTEVKVRELPPCDFNAEHGPAAVDGRTRRGPWAYMCDGCWRREGVGRLGTGFGQRLVLDAPEGPSAAAERPEAPSGPVVPAEAPAPTSAAQGPESGPLRRCAGCGWETIAERCPHCGADVEGRAR